ncbi:methylmalonyl-CoA/ethylmalonyl-CoA epimerase [Methylacidimicrobium cyclopophantes]|uniref:Methylmalonyl-CoA/ethylmalonyl-CoA epimerase n=1 Tax=Methylacidimicrobium cyclopophantes TaxID=1041766 RepID=A0A5E6MD77_9BACT|nr:VOC family protein [Methylacidimicrobium cyclopophantes]VVM07131.1 methylmalonyl-CoA/ethylmalonyl-CoA epimerase [Methylacidimicrobium cyclopophantes]
MKITLLHHVALPVTDLEKSKSFYREILGLQEIPRAPFPFPGAWFALPGGQRVHLIVSSGQTFRSGKGIDQRDVHFALRVASYREALEELRRKGYTPEAADELHRIKVDPHSVAGFPQLYLLDPDRNLIEINAEKLDL